MRLKELRVNHNLKQKELGQITGISEAAISRFEAGNRTPSMDVALALANYFNVSLDYLVGATDFPYPLSEKVINIINQANNPEELIIKINELREKEKSGQTAEQSDPSEIKDLIKDLDTNSIEELQKYADYLKVKQTLDKGDSESSAGLDTVSGK